MSNATTSSNKVPFGQKVAFGLGMLANQMFAAALGIFMVVLVQDLGFPGWMWGILFFLPRVYDSITDPIMGFITDNTRSVWGRRRHYVFMGAVIMGISFVAMWQLHRENGQGKTVASTWGRNGARSRVRTIDPFRVKEVLYH